MLINGSDLFSFVGAPDNDPAFVQFVKIKRVERLTAFEHHIVGDVDNVIDRVDSGTHQFVLQPIRTCSDFHAFDNSGVVFMAQVRAIQLY